MEIQVVVKQVLDNVTFPKRDGSGEIVKGGFVAETLGQYPKTIKFDVMGDKLQGIMSQVLVGNTISVSFDISSREWNGKWFTELQVWKTAFVSGTQPANGHTQQAAPQAQSPVPNAQPAPAAAPQQEQANDLPF